MTRAPTEEVRLFNKALRQAAIIPLLIAILLSGFFIWRIERLSQAAAWLDHTDQVISQAFYLERLLMDLQTSMRGYALKANPESAKIFEETLPKIPETFKKLSDLVADNSAQSENIRQMQKVSNEWLTNTVETRTNSSAAIEKGIPIVMQVRSRFAEFVLEEEKLRDERGQRLQRATQIALGSAAVLTILMALLILSRGRKLFDYLSRSYRDALEREIRKSEELQDAVRSRDEFLSIASHELKTPLTSLKLQLDLMEKTLRERRDALTPARVSKMTAFVQNQIARLNALVEDLLDVSRVRSGHLTYHFELLDLRTLTLDLLKRASEQFRIEGRALEAKLGDKPVFVRADRFRIEQILNNLLSNALKYGGSEAIHVSLEMDDGHACVSVRDEGMGIPSEKQDVIFKRFERATDSSHISGLGLGLYISKEIAEAHGGTLTVESKIAHGSVFTLMLPLHDISSRALK